MENKLIVSRDQIRNSWFEAMEHFKKGDFEPDHPQYDPERKKMVSAFQHACSNKQQLLPFDTDLVKATLGYAEIYAPLNSQIAFMLADVYKIGIPGIVEPNIDKEYAHINYGIKAQSIQKSWDEVCRNNMVDLNSLLTLLNIANRDLGDDAARTIGQKVLKKIQKMSKHSPSACFAISSINADIVCSNCVYSEKKRREALKKVLSSFVNGLNLESISKDQDVTRRQMRKAYSRIIGLVQKGILPKNDQTVWFIQKIVEITTNEKYIERFKAAKEVLNAIDQQDSQKAFIIATTLSSRFLLSSSLIKIDLKKYSKLAQLLGQQLTTNPIETMLLYDQEGEWWKSPPPPLNLQNAEHPELVSFLNHYVHGEFEAIDDLINKMGTKTEYLPFLADMSATGKGRPKSIEQVIIYAQQFLDACEKNEILCSPFIQEKLLSKMNDILMDVRNESPLVVELFLKSFYQLLIGIKDNVRISQFASIFELCALQETKFSDVIVQSLGKFEDFFSKFVELNSEALTVLGSMQQYRYKCSKEAGEPDQLYLETALRYYDQALALAPRYGQHINLFTINSIRQRRATAKCELALCNFERGTLLLPDLILTFKEVLADDCNNNAPIVFCLNRTLKTKNDPLGNAIVPLIEYAANQGNGVLQFQLGSAYAKNNCPLVITDPNLIAPSSISLPTNLAKARHFLELAAEHNKEAAHMVGQFYLLGNDAVQINEEKAIQYLTKAIKNGSSSALIDLALMRLKNKQYEELRAFLAQEVTVASLQPFNNIIKAAIFQQAADSKVTMVQGILAGLLSISFDQLDDNKSIVEINQLIERLKIESTLKDERHELVPCITVILDYICLLQLEPNQKETECEKIIAQLEQLQKNKNNMVKLSALLLQTHIQFERGIKLKNEKIVLESCKSLVILIREMPQVNNVKQGSFESFIIQEAVNKGFELLQQFEKLPETIINPELKRSWIQKIEGAIKSNPIFQIMNMVKGLAPNHLLKMQF